MIIINGHTDRRDIAEEFIKDEGCWLNMISEEANTAFEAWEKDQKTNCSLFHLWATAPIMAYANISRIY